MSIEIVIILILSGLVVGFINTLAGGATIISMSILMWLGLPISVANGTNRVAVFFQTLFSVNSFRKQKVLDIRKSLLVGIPTVIGSVVGSFIAVKLDESIVQTAFAIIMVIMLFFVLFKPSLWLKGNPELLVSKIRWINYPVFFLIGVYGGFLHVGVGYYLLATIVLGLGFDLMRANAIKNMLVWLYVPFSLILFIINDQVMWKYGLIHSIGNIIGALLAAKLAVKKGAGFIRIIMVIVIVISLLNIFRIVNFSAFFARLAK